MKIIIDSVFVVLPYVFAVFVLMSCVNITLNNFMIISSYKYCEQMPFICSNLGYVINLSGKKGSGKTTTGAGIVNYLVLYIQNKLVYELNLLRIRLNFVDFNKLEILFDYNLKNANYHLNLALKKTLEIFNPRGLWTDNLNIKSYTTMIEDYLKRYFILNYRKNYVISKTNFYCPVTKENALLLDPTSLELRNALDKENYQLDFGMVIFDDEKQLDSGNVYSNDKEKKLSGKKESRALIRNAYENLCFEVTTKQVDDDEIKQERMQIDANLNIRRRKEINFSKLSVKIMKCIYNLLYLPRGLIYCISKDGKIKREEFLKSKSKLRNFEKFIDDVDCILSSRGYIVVYVRKYFNADDVGKQNPELYEKLKLVFEKDFCYGSIDTHEWKALAKYFDNFRYNAVYSKTSLFDDVAKVDTWLKAMNKK